MSLVLNYPANVSPTTSANVGQVAARPSPSRRGWFRRATCAIGAASWWLFCLASLIGLLALVTAIPILQLLSLGYLLTVAGRLARGEPWRGGLPGFRQAGQIGLALTALGLASLPTRLLSHWESVARVIEPGSATAENLRIAAITLSLVLLAHLWWAWARGGRLSHYLWPQPKRFLLEAWRPSTWLALAERLSGFVGSLQLPSLFWLGLRGAIGTLIWLVPALIVMAVTRNGQNGSAGLVGGSAIISLAGVLLTLPMLQVNFAAENRFRAMFAWRQVRQDFVYAPWSWAGANLLGLLLLPLPLYLLKIEAIPREIIWLPCVFFVALMIPARMAEGAALARCRRLRLWHESGDAERANALRPSWRVRWGNRWWIASRWLVRLVVMPAIVSAYLLVLLLSQYTSWIGIDTWIAQHALLVPVPFAGV